MSPADRVKQATIQEQVYNPAAIDDDLPFEQTPRRRTPIRH